MQISPDTTTKIPALNGWVYVTPLAGNRFRLTATGRRAEIASSADVRLMVNELIQSLGGPMIRQRTECDRARTIVKRLLQ